MKKLISIFLFLLLLSSCETATKNKNQNENKKDNTEKISLDQQQQVKYKTVAVKNLNIAYREAGNPKNPTIVLLHGFPSSSHQYRKILRELSDQYHLIAPDYPGFGNSDFPSATEYEYTFDNLAKTVDSFLEQLGLNSYTLMIQDYGAPIGFRIAMAHPERVTAIINQNGNAYEEGLGEAWADIKALWADRNTGTEEACLPAFSLEGLKWQYTHGTRNIENINPDSWQLDYLRLSRPGAHAIHIGLFYDYRNNLKLYPQWQEYLRKNQPPMLIVWGKNDEFFPESGAAAYKKDLNNIDYNIYDTGHFALDEDGYEIIGKMRDFMGKL